MSWIGLYSIFAIQIPITYFPESPQKRDFHVDRLKKIKKKKKKQNKKLVKDLLKNIKYFTNQ